MRAKVSRGNHTKRQGNEDGEIICREREGEDSPEGTGACQGVSR